MLIPDNSPNANQQFPTIALKKPGFSAQVLVVPKKGTLEEQSLWSVLVSGKKNDSDYYLFKELVWEKEGILLTNFYNRKEIISYQDLMITPRLESGETQGTYDFFGESLKKQKEIKQRSISKKRFYLGTDKFGRDIFSRIILGIRISIFVGLVAVFISLIVGIFMGSIGGYFGGKIDQFIMLILNVSWSIPTLLMVFAIVLAFDRGISVIFIAVGLTMWVEVARIVRGQVKAIREEQFVMAAKNMGFRTSKIIVQHILPNIIGPILVIAAANFSTAVLVEAGLSYLGFGIEPPTPSIGNMLNEHYGYALTGKVFLAIVPAITIMFLVLSFNLVGSGLRDAFDVKRQDT